MHTRGSIVRADTRVKRLFAARARAKTLRRTLEEEQAKGEAIVDNVAVCVRTQR